MRPESRPHEYAAAASACVLALMTLGTKTAIVDVVLATG